MRSQNSLPARFDHPLYRNRPRSTAMGMPARIGRRKRRERRIRRWTAKAETRCSRQPLMPVPVGSERFSRALVASWCTCRTSIRDASPSPASSAIRFRMLCNAFLEVSSCLALSISATSVFAVSFPKKHSDRQWLSDGTVADTIHGHPSSDSNTVQMHSAIMSMSYPPPFFSLCSLAFTRRTVMFWSKYMTMKAKSPPTTASPKPAPSMSPRSTTHGRTSVPSVVEVMPSSLTSRNPSSKSSYRPISAHATPMPTPMAITGAKSAMRLRTHWLKKVPLRELRMPRAVKHVRRPTKSAARASPWPRSSAWKILTKYSRAE
mmetsp:Transcript_14289/g.28461  ORF Transcript_14289/g.28461 Transcript_14289/m.28461 type:complete len:319 (+) Transcript_14289:312-1268(+)